MLHCTDKMDNFSYRAIRLKSMKTLHFLPEETIAIALFHLENYGIVFLYNATFSWESHVFAFREHRSL